MHAFDKSIALLLIRTITGILFFFQAYDKIFRVGLKNVADAFGIPFGRKIIKMHWAVILSSYVELIAGSLLFLGLFKSFALYLLAGDLFAVALSFSLIKPMLDMQYYFPRLVLIILLLLLPANWDPWSLDHLFMNVY